jgi:hypothetical protein
MLMHKGWPASGLKTLLLSDAGTLGVAVGSGVSTVQVAVMVGLIVADW